MRRAFSAAGSLPRLRLCSLIFEVLVLQGVAALGQDAGRAETGPKPGREVKPFVIDSRKGPALTHEQKLALVRQRIKHVFILFQENRSFDFYFGSFPGADGLL